MNLRELWLGHCKSGRQTVPVNKSSFPDDGAFLHIGNTYRIENIIHTTILNFSYFSYFSYSFSHFHRRTYIYILYFMERIESYNNDNDGYVKDDKCAVNHLFTLPSPTSLFTP